MRKFLWIVIVVAGIVLAAVLLVKFDAAPSAAGAAKESAAAESGDLPASSVLRINPRRTPAAPATSPAKAAPVVTPDIALLRQRKGWAELYARASGGPQTAEALYIQAEIYLRCARRPPTANAPAPLPQADAREKFIASLQGDPNGEQRIAAYEKTKVDPCEGLALGEFSKEKVAQMVAAAAAAGDPRAQAWQLARQIEGTYFDAQPRPQGYAVSDEQMESIRRLLASGDPGVLVDLQGILSSTLVDGNLRMGPNNERVDSNAMAAALTLVACDLGAQCGADSQRLLMQCAMQGYCGANNLYDYTYFYESSPFQAQLMEQYRQTMLQMARNRDFSGLQLVREPTTPGMSYARGGRRLGP
jgi:hypothetical protein